MSDNRQTDPQLESLNQRIKTALAIYAMKYGRI